jgi:NhaP-type Na+/H+ or K+/H+ antiporter
MKFKGKIMLVVGIMLGLGLIMKGDFIEGFQGGNLISSITSLVIMSGLILGGIILMIIGRNE